MTVPSITKIGDKEKSGTTYEGNAVLDAIYNYGIGSLGFVCGAMVSVHAVYCFTTFTKLEPLAKVGGQTNWKLMKAMFNSVS